MLMSNADELDKLLTQFVSFERPEVKTFREAIEYFKRDLPTVVEALRGMIEEQTKINITFTVTCGTC